MIEGTSVFDWFALVISLIVVLSIYLRKAYRGIENRVFLGVVLIGLFTTVFELISDGILAVTPLTRTTQGIVYLALYGYFINRQMSVISYIMLAFSASGTTYRMKELKNRILFTGPFFLLSVFIITNFFHRQIFNISMTEGYARGPLMFIVFGFSMVYGTIGLLYLFTVRKYLGTTKWVAMMLLFISIAFSVVVQYYHPTYRIEMLSAALAVLILHLIVQRSEDLMDQTTGLYAWQLYQEETRRLMLAEKQVSIFVVRFLNATEVRIAYTEDRYNAYIKEKAELMKKIMGKRIKDYKIYIHSSGSMHLVVGKKNFDFETETPELLSLFTDDIAYDGFGQRLRPLMCSIEYMRDFHNPADLIQFGLFFPQFMKPNQTFIRASDVVHEKNYEIQKNIPKIISRGLRDNNFEMYYQPIYDVKKKCFHSAEALIRLNDEEYGFLSPGIFIPAAERQNMIFPIGNFVLEEVFEFVGRDDFERLGLTYIELNLSVDQFLHENLHKQIAQLETRIRTKPERINLEVTESVAGISSTIGRMNIEMLRKRGYSFSLDDYGTGYSNIQRAMSLPLSLIKIDKSLVDEVETKNGAVIIENTIQMMHEVGFQIVCEGVETANQYRILEAMGCDYIQGYYFAKPMSKADFVRFLIVENHCEK